MKRCSKSLAARQLQRKSTMRSNYTLIRISKIRNTDNTNCLKDVDQLDLSYINGISLLYKWKKYATQNWAKEIFYSIHNIQNLEVNQVPINHGRILKLSYVTTVLLSNKQRNRLKIPPPR